jgi:hypothetical protein
LTSFVAEVYNHPQKDEWKYPKGGGSLQKIAVKFPKAIEALQSVTGANLKKGDIKKWLRQNTGNIS